MNFLSPIAFVALSAIAIPVIVHLWHTRKGRTLRIGSIKLFTANSQRSASSRTIRNWPLFLLRCLIVVVSVTLVAHPVQTVHADALNKGWILVTGTDYRTAYGNASTTFDSLIAAGYSIHRAEAGFEKLQPADSATMHNRTNRLSIWQIIRELETRLPSGFPVFIFSADGLDEIYGSRPVSTLAISIRQLPRTATDTVVTLTPWVTPDHQQRQLTWHSRRDGNYFIASDTTVSLNATADTHSIRVGIYPDVDNVSGSYMQAALKAISGYTKRTIETGPGNGSVLYDLLIVWDKDKNPDSILRRITDSGTIIIQTTAVEKNVNDAMIVVDEQPVGRQPFIHVSRHGSTATNGKVIWQTASGDPLLVLEQHGKKKVFHLAMELSPEATGVVWDETLVKELLSILLPGTTAGLPDERQPDQSQLLPVQSDTAVPGPATVFTEEYDLRPWFGALLAILFLTERIIVSLQSNRRANG